MRPKHFWKKPLTTLRFIGVLVVFAMFLFTSCVKNELSSISDNVRMHQSFSVPLGVKKLDTYAPSSDTSSVPGVYGTFYYDKKPYPANASSMQANFDEIELNLSNNAQTSWITSFTFSIVCENHFPAKVYFKASLNGAAGFSNIFGKDSIAVDPGGTVIREVPYSTALGNLGILLNSQQMTYYVSVSLLNSPQLDSTNYFKVDAGARIVLDYNIKQLIK
jgi:hypothetical protein